jgi:predicted dienelactone hydrolase
MLADFAHRCLAATRRRRLMPRFPSPTGPYPVGTATRRITDMNRPVHLLRDEPGRALFVRLWYPAEDPGTKPEALWADLRDAAGLPPPMRLLMAYLRNVRTSSRRDAPFARSIPPRGLVVYSHGLVSFAAENTALMEDLASHGYVVMALQHLEQMAELQALNRGQTAADRKADRAMAAS